MEPKKNPKADLTKNSSMYFVIGLAAVLLMTYVALEWKTYDNANDYDISMNVDDELDEEVPMTEQIKTPPPPPPPAAPEVIEVVEDEEEIEETVIESTETSQDEEIIEVEDVAVEEVDEDLDVPFAVIEDVPIFPGCEGEKGKGPAAMRACFQSRMRGPDKNLEKEAARIIGKLPKMTPGKQRGRAVRVPFSIPITFKLQ